MFPTSFPLSFHVSSVAAGGVNYLHPASDSSRPKDGDSRELLGMVRGKGS